MPVDFKDLASLKRAAKQYGFRDILEGETEAAYRTALAAHVRHIDFVASSEIKSGVGWSEGDFPTMMKEMSGVSPDIIIYERGHF